MVFFDVIFFSSLCIASKQSGCNFALEDVCYIRLRFDCSKIDEDIDKNWEEKSDKVDKSGFELVIIKNPAIIGWYL